jgi:uncharacterized BrkB/YihY/UPF0761 family membrane protein
MDAGDFVFAGHIAFEVVWQAVERGDRLANVLNVSQRYADRIATSLWSANQAIKALFDSLNVVFREKEQRSFIRRTECPAPVTVTMLA